PPTGPARSVGEPEPHDDAAVVHAGRFRPLRLLPEPDLRAQRTARRDRDVLLAVDRVADDAARLRRAEIERPQLLTILGVDGNHFALGGALEDQVARRGERVADERRAIGPLPHDLVLVNVEGAQDAGLLVATEVLGGDAGKELAALVGEIGHVRVLHAELVRRNIEVAGLRIEDLRLPASAAEERRAHLYGRAAHSRSAARLLGDLPR